MPWTLPDQSTDVRYAVGSTPQSTFEVPFAFVEPGDLRVWINGVETTSFSVVGSQTDIGFYSGGTLTLGSPVTGAVVTIQRRTRLVQRWSAISATALALKHLSLEIARVIGGLQDARTLSRKGLRAPDDEADVAALPARSSRAGKLLVFDGGGEPAAGSSAQVAAAFGVPADGQAHVLRSSGPVPLVQEAVPLAGGVRLTGQVEVGVAPSAGEHIATKGYVDQALDAGVAAAVAATAVPRSGGVVMTGQVEMDVAPSVDRHLATKGYVDSVAGTGGSGGLPEAPNDGVAYVRRNSGWTSGDARYVGLLASAAAVPAGTTAERPGSPPAGATRWNATLAVLETWDGSAWVAVGPGQAAGTSANLLWAESAGDLPGSGFTWPGLYRGAGASWTLEKRIATGIAFRTLPAPQTGSGTPQQFTRLTTGVAGSTHTTMTVSGVNIPAGVVVLLFDTNRDDNIPTVSSITHPALSNIVERATTLFASTPNNRKSRPYIFTAESSGGTGDLVITLSGSAWASHLQIMHVPSANVGAFIGATFSSPVTSGSSASISRSGGSPKIDICFFVSYTSVATPTVTVSRNSDSLATGPAAHSYYMMASTSAAGDGLDGATQTFTLDSGTINAAVAGIIQFAAPPGGSPAEYTLTANDFGQKLLCQTGQTNLTLPVLTAPSGSDANGPTGIEQYVLVEVPPSSVLQMYRGSGAQLWTGIGSGDVSGGAVTCQASQRKIIGLGYRHGGLWQVVSGAVD